MKTSTLFFSLFISLFMSLFIANSATAQQQRGQLKPTLSPKLKLPDVNKNQESFSCRITGLEMTTDGLGYFCTYRKNKYLVVFNGGKKPGGISSTMSLLVGIKSGDFGSGAMVRGRIKAPDKASQRICDLIQGPAGRKNNVRCREAISIGWRLINTGTARPSYPDIPTGTARPSQPDIPTQDAKPD